MRDMMTIIRIELFLSAAGFPSASDTPTGCYTKHATLAEPIVKFE